MPDGVIEAVRSLLWNEFDVTFRRDFDRCMAVTLPDICERTAVVYRTAVTG